jgi:hypothetical protein
MTVCTAKSAAEVSTRRPSKGAQFTIATPEVNRDRKEIVG